MDEARLRIRIEELEEENRQLRELLAPRTPLPYRWKLSHLEGRLLTALRAAGHGGIAKERAMAALYGATADAPFDKVVAVRISHLRTKLRAAEPGLVIETIWGAGYRLTPESLVLFDAAVAAEGECQGRRRGRPRSAEAA